ncbi:MAG: hypothetical protein NTX79_02645 [Candidatus Micrarchaeota archaeon]|nr:hypothetical protein [Candidatus Micrarchaeota archaeon]
MIFKKCNLGKIVNNFDPNHYGSGKGGKYGCMKKILESGMKLKPLDPGKYDRTLRQGFWAFFHKA